MLEPKVFLLSILPNDVGGIVSFVELHRSAEQSSASCLIILHGNQLTILLLKGQDAHCRGDQIIIILSNFFVDQILVLMSLSEMLLFDSSASLL